MRVRGGSWAPKRAVVAGSAALVVSVVLAGCTNNVFGTAQRASDAPPPGIVDVTLLDTGNYATKPAPPLGPAGTEFKGKLLDAARMIEFVTGPWEVDPTLVDASGPTVILKGASAIMLVQPEVIAKAVETNEAFLYGFTGMRKGGDTVLQNTVLRFRDPQAAIDAAKTMGEAALKELDESPSAIEQPVAPLTFPDRPDTVGTTYQIYLSYDKRSLATARTYTPHGPYVLVQRADTTGGRMDVATALVAKTIDMQKPLIDKFQPTDPAKFAELPLDPTGLIARMLPQNPDDITVNELKPFGRHATLFYQDNPVTTNTMFETTGMDLFVQSKPNVYQTKDAATAGRLVEDFASSFTDRKEKPYKAVDGVNFMPASRCLESPVNPDIPDDKSSYYCVAPADRWLIEANSGQLRDAQQQIAAQYVMLLAK